MPGKILIVDDDPSLLKVITYHLNEAGYHTKPCANGAAALKALKGESFDLILTDLKMPDMDGMELMRRSREIHPDIPVVLITAFAAIESAVEAIRAGAMDYIPKPFVTDDLLNKVKRAIESGMLKEENIRLKQELARRDGLDEIIGNSEPMRNLFEMVSRVAATDATVLIGGESGTGKELLARAIHRLSPRASKPLVAINCAAIPRDLLESELFGHVRGAFTGAVKDRIGVFEQADGGTLFLDEVGDISLDLQPKLLRVIQERVLTRVGDNTVRKFDVRIIAATKTELQDMVKRGRFREDLYYRLNVVPLMMPPLRERKGDVPILAAHFIAKHFPGKNITLTPEALRRLESYNWPGNARELENVIERAGILIKDNSISGYDLPNEIGGSSKKQAAKTNAPDEATLWGAERSMIEDTMNKTGGNRAEAARILGIPRHVLIYRLKKYGIEDS